MPAADAFPAGDPVPGGDPAPAADVVEDADDPMPDPGHAAPTVTVTGHAVIRAEPDEAALWVTVSALEDSPAKALADVARRSDLIVAILDELGIEKGDRSTTGVRVQEEIDHTSEGQRSLGFKAAAGVSVRITQIDIAGQLISRVASEVEATVAGPRWYVSPSNSVRLEVAKLAAGDARRRAEAFAAGVDARLGDLIRLAEPDPGAQMIRASAATLRPMAADVSMPIEPGEQEVVASIEATFALVWPDTEAALT